MDLLATNDSRSWCSFRLRAPRSPVVVPLIKGERLESCKHMYLLKCEVAANCSAPQAHCDRCAEKSVSEVLKTIRYR